MPQFICAFYPKKSAIVNGAVAMTICLEAKTIKLADMKSTIALEESFADTSDNFFKPKISEYTLGDSGRPPVGSFDTEWIKNYEWNDETKKFDLIPTVVTSNDIDIETDPLENARVISDLPVGERVTYILMYGATPEEIDHEHLSNAVDMFVDDEAPEEIRMMIDGMLKIPSINAMKPTSVAEIIDLIRAVMPPVESAEEVAKLAIGYAKNPAERGEQVERSKSGISRSYDLLDTEAALHVMGIRPSAAKASDLRNAKYLKDDRDPTWRAWSTEYRIIPDILNIDGDELFDLMAEGHKDLKLNNDVEARRQFVSGKLRGHPLLPNYPLEDQPKIENLGNAKFSIEGLTAGDEKTRPEIEPSVKRNEYTNAVHVAIAKVISGELPKIITREEIETIIPGDLEEDGGAGIVADLLKCIVNADINSSLGKDDVTQLTAAILRSYVDNNLFDEDNLESFVTSSIKGGGVKEVNDKQNLKPVATVTNIDVKQTKTDTKPAQIETKTTIAVPDTGGNAPKLEVGATEAVSVASNSVGVAQDDFKQRAAALEKGLSEKSEEVLENLHIWKQVQSTDPRYTKPLEGAGFAGTSINAEYMFMRATEVFGPVGTGWGYEIVEDRMLNGAPLSEQIYENNKFVRSVLLRDADGTLLFEQNHVLRIKFWYAIEGDVRGELEAYGSTPYLYKSKRGITTDGETHKKSLTDAIKKALSMLGFSADVWLGWHDMPDYLADNAIEYGIKNASDKAEDVVRLRKELDEKFTANTETMRTAVTANEVTKIASSLTRTVGVHIKSAKGINDTEYVRYLESRLKRLEEIKAECLAKFEEVKA
ncbi:hypothetical protein ERD95_08205 [Enterobacteriaceae bacterium ML5]|nr:hypothetical protein ERD95_08205 [Enterobacteriaceae bacterium ML5]